jgi:hypothetical protein
MRNRIATGSIGAIVLSTILASMACSGPSDTGEPKATVPAHQDGATVFRGVFFGEGPTAQRLPELWGESAVQQRMAMTKSPEQLALQLETAIARMKADGWSEDVVARAEQALESVRSGQSIPDVQPTDISTFRELMIAQIAAADPAFFDRFGADMQSGDHLRVEHAMTEAEGKVRSTVETFGTGGEPTANPSLVWYYGPVLVAVAAVAVAVAVVVVVVDVEGPDNSRLKHDELIDLYAQRLRG